ncbi:MAG: DUF4105 domain-containing protein [Bryobacteraceae bacterium]
MIRKVGLGVLFTVLAMLSLWAAAALAFDFEVRVLRIPAAIMYLVTVIAIVVLARKPILAAGPCFAAFALVLVWWVELPPSNRRNWQGDVAEAAWADVKGPLVTIHNYRNFEYRTETDFTPHWETKVIEVPQIRGIDLFVDYWGSPWIAHVIVSFELANGDHVATSVEARKEAGETYSSIRGFFRQYELIYVVGDERDLVRVRTNYRQGEDVYLYRTRATPERSQKLFLQYMREINQLHKRPQWYNALTSNCTTNIAGLMRDAGGTVPWWDWRTVLNGKGDQMMYENGDLAGDLPFAELKRRALINPAAREADKAPDFSQRIRAGRPGF